MVRSISRRQSGRSCGPRSSCERLASSRLRGCPPQLLRRLDVQDFGTPIRTIETTSVGGHARMTVELAGAGEIAVYQVNRQIILAPH